MLDVARCLGVSRAWILAQEREGRIPLVMRDRNGHRRFTELDVERLQRLLFEGADLQETPREEDVDAWARRHGLVDPPGEGA